ncbi:MAG: sulfite exporter TauE/SafE family protein [Burkholderiales bacterium]|nr:sulfite exporter TauE/SafE family protein [Burkholderiales bacterium]
MEALGTPQLVFCALVVMLAFAVRGGAGFGGGAIAVPLLALVLPLQVVVSAVAVLNMLSSVGHGVRDWRGIVWREILRLIPYTLLGVGIGLYLLAKLDPKPLSRALGIFVVLYALYSMTVAGRALAVSARWRGWLCAATGTSAGFIGTLFGGAAGPLYVVYLNALKFDRDAFRVTITTIMLFQGLARITGYAGLGFYNAATLTLLAAALPVMLIGSWFGMRIVQRFDQARFSFAVGCVLMVSGFALIFK